MTLPSTGGPINLRDRTRRRCVLYFYPRTGRPGVALPKGWDEIPGARGCTPQSCGFRDHSDGLRELGSDVMGLSSQTTQEQREFAERVGLPFPLVSDPALLLAEHLRLPTFEVESLRLYKRSTLIAEDSVIVKVFYPVFPPDRNAEEVIGWLATNRPR